MLRQRQVTPRRSPCIAAAALAALGATIVATGRAHAQSVTISVDATTPGAPIERIWEYHGFDEVNNAVSSEGRSLLGTLGRIDPTPPHVRMHFLLNTGDGTPALKWGSTNVYTEDATGNPVYSWTITDQIMDARAIARWRPMASSCLSWAPSGCSPPFEATGCHPPAPAPPA